MKHHRPCMLMILDGWGIGDGQVADAVAVAATPHLDRLAAVYPTTRLQCSGEAVGLPSGIMGNSEVGHLNIGAGRIVYQDLLRIDTAIGEGSFFKNSVLLSAMAAVGPGPGALHLMGLVSDGGVHSQLTHLFALIDMAAANGVRNLFIHVILDGRDTAPDAGVSYVRKLAQHLQSRGRGAIASIIGRYWAMDRDKRWDRTERAYRLFTMGEGTPRRDPVAAIQEAYSRKETDEFVTPIVMVDTSGDPLGVVNDGDSILFYNFRADRVRQITRAFTDDAFDGFVRTRRPRLATYTCMTLYDETFTLPVAFPPVRLDHILGQVLSDHGKRQLRIAETEKYAHVTYFFNGGEEKPFALEDRALIPSPRDVSTYDHKPEMSAHAVTEEVVRRLLRDDYDCIILNFANMDMVGHTGNMAAAVKACETVDVCVGRIVEEVRRMNGVILITADHGNSELMANPDGSVHTAHTTNPVRLILVDDSRSGVALREGLLADIAPTMLEIMGVEPPEAMTGRSLIVQ